LRDAKYYKCTNCGYEFLARSASLTCPRCKSNELEVKDIKSLTDIED
jgi:predicted Zn-ribbon and HTH transcriptional regulator